MLTKQILLTVGLFIVALVSGIVVGRSTVNVAPAVQAQERSWLADELKLTPEQREQMREIWQETLRGDGQRQHERRRQIQRERDEAMVALLTPEQQEKQKQILERYQQQMAEISKEREAAFASAVEQTRKILDEQQRARYEEMLKRGPEGSRGGRRPGGWRGGGPGGPATAPAEETRNER